MTPGIRTVGACVASTLAGVLGGCYRFHCRFTNMDRVIPVVKSSQGVNGNGLRDIVGWYTCFMLVASEYDAIPSMEVMDTRLLSTIPCRHPSISLHWLIGHESHTNPRKELIVEASLSEEAGPGIKLASKIPSANLQTRLMRSLWFKLPYSTWLTTIQELVGHPPRGHRICL